MEGPDDWEEFVVSDGKGLPRVPCVLLFPLFVIPLTSIDGVLPLLGVLVVLLSFDLLRFMAPRLKERPFSVRIDPQGLTGVDRLRPVRLHAETPLEVSLAPAPGSPHAVRLRQERRTLLIFTGACPRDQELIGRIGTLWPEARVRFDSMGENGEIQRS